MMSNIIEKVTLTKKDIYIAAFECSKKIKEKGFLVGGGFDFNGKFRDLPYIGTLKYNLEEMNEKTY